MFTLFSGRHNLVYHWGTCTPIWHFYTRLCKFVRNISTNIWGLGKRTGLELGQVSYFFIFYKLTSQFLSFLHWIVFDLFFYCVTVKTIYNKLKLKTEWKNKRRKDSPLQYHYVAIRTRELNIIWNHLPMKQTNIFWLPRKDMYRYQQLTKSVRVWEGMREPES